MLVDPREGGGAGAGAGVGVKSSVMTLRGHSNKVVAVSPGAGSGAAGYALVSGSHDGTCMVWDLRAGGRRRQDGGGAAAGDPVGDPVYVIERESRRGRKRPVAGEGCKVFDVVWDAALGIVSAGEDRSEQINKGTDVVATIS